MNKIMIVEDSEDIRGLLKNYLEKYGYQTVIAADFTAVLDVFLREKPDVVLLDINLPSYDGYYWCRQIRQHSTSPIIFISARSGEMDQVMAIENGGDDYIEKTVFLRYCPGENQKPDPQGVRRVRRQAGRESD